MGDDVRFRRWKESATYIYDFLSHSKLEWPSMSVVWGDVSDRQPTGWTQTIYYSDRTGQDYDPANEDADLDPDLQPNSINIGYIDLKRKCTDALRLKNLESKLHNRIKKIIHPGEVNRMRGCTQHRHILATHTDHTDVFIWDTKRQPSRQEQQNEVPTPSIPDLTLRGHTDIADYALDWAATSIMVASGGKDRQVLVWNLEDYRSPFATSAESNPSKTSTTYLSPRTCFKGHENGGHESSVEDVKFNPKDENVLCSVGDDRMLIFWDQRSPNAPTSVVREVHSDDVHCVDWNSDQTYVLTGSEAAEIHIFDVRKLPTSSKKEMAVQTISTTSPVFTAAWSPKEPHVFAAACQDGLVNVYRLNAASASASCTSAPDDHYGPMFNHAGLRGEAMDVQWNFEDEWMIACISDDSAIDGGGGCMQIFRMSELVYLPLEKAAEAVREMLF